MESAHDKTSPEESRVREAVGFLSEPKPTEAFRRTLRGEFSDGRILERAKQNRRRWPTIYTILFRVLAPAAAASVIGMWIWQWNSPPAWEVSGLMAEGTLIVDGTSYAMTEFAEVEKYLVPGARLELRSETDLELVSDGVIAIQLTPQSSMRLPAVPGRLFGRSAEGELYTGEIRVATGKDFHGAELFIRTAEADVQIMGSTMAVIRDSVSTCVCAYEGCIFMAPGGDELSEVPNGMRRFVYNDGRPSEEMAIDDLENMKLQMFIEGAAPALGRAEENE
jgi:hypothetical protein